MEASRWKESSDLWTELLAIDADHVTGLIGQTVCLVALGKNEAAFASANRAIELGAGDRTTLWLRANLRAEHGDFEDAVDDLNRLIERDSDDSEVLRDRGLAYLKLGRLELALKDTDAALELAATDAVAWNNRGAILIELGRFDEATETLKKAVELDPGFDRPKAHLDRLESKDQKALVESNGSDFA
jgi:tetratricopeptide (TPR) repeat protein